MVSSSFPIGGEGGRLKGVVGYGADLDLFLSSFRVPHVSLEINRTISELLKRVHGLCAISGLK